jgi:5-hydroxyisourate hydrolase-like protein (transthyretin family)
MPRWRPVVGLGAASCLFALAAGCGRNDRPWEVVPVSGTVTYQGQPVAGVTVEFEPESGRPSQGLTDENGRFVLNYTIHENGAQVGTHKVTFTWADRFEGDRPTPLVEELVRLHGRNGEPLTVEITGETDDLKIEVPFFRT